MHKKQIIKNKNYNPEIVDRVISNKIYKCKHKLKPKSTPAQSDLQEKCT